MRLFGSLCLETIVFKELIRPPAIQASSRTYGSLQKLDWIGTGKKLKTNRKFRQDLGRSHKVGKITLVLFKVSEL